MAGAAFDWSEIALGQKGRATIDVRAGDDAIALPILYARGERPGKTLLVSAGVHGDEYEGIRAIFDVFEELDPKAMSGAFIALTVANPPAFWAGTRSSPIDRANLARVFPGKQDGTATEAIAFHIDRDLLPLADLYLDFHSAGIMCEMPPLIGYHEPDALARDAAFAFGIQIVWCHPAIAPGRTVSAAIARGVPALYTETRGAGRIDDADLHLYKRGAWNLLKHLGIISGEPETWPDPLCLFGDGNVDDSISSTQRGFLISAVHVLEEVTKGQKLGTLVDLWGQRIEEFHAPRDGRVVLIHARPLVHPDEPLFLITGAR